MLARLDEDLAFLSEQVDGLLKKYNGEFVAISNRKLVAHAPDIRALKRKLRELGIGTNEVLVHFLADENQTLIL